MLLLPAVRRRIRIAVIGIDGAYKSPRRFHERFGLPGRQNDARDSFVGVDLRVRQSLTAAVAPDPDKVRDQVRIRFRVVEILPRLLEEVAPSRLIRLFRRRVPSVLLRPERQPMDAVEKKFERSMMNVLA